MMKTWISCLAFVIAAVSPAAAGSVKDIKKEIAVTNKAIETECGCTVGFSYSSQFDFTEEHGSNLAYLVEKSIESVGEEATKWCKQGEEFKEKFCVRVQVFEVDEDTSTKKPYTRALGPGVVRNYIAGKNPKQRSFDGSWVKPFLQTGKMRDRKPEDEN